MDKANFTSIVFGEILYDCFPDRTLLGGCLPELRWNLRQLGFPVAMISAVGGTNWGNRAGSFLRRADIAQQWVADRSEPTGTVDVLLDAGQPSYTIRAGVAWDYIETKPALDRPPDLIYYGTAAQRSLANRPGLEHLLAANPRHRFFDVNLREDCYTPADRALWSRSGDHCQAQRRGMGGRAGHRRGRHTRRLAGPLRAGLPSDYLWRRRRSVPHSGGLVCRTARARVRRRCGRGWRRLQRDPSRQRPCSAPTRNRRWT